MAIETTKWDAAKYLGTAEMVSAYLDAAVETGDAAVLAAVLGDIARAKGMTEVAKGSGRDA